MKVNKVILAFELCNKIQDKKDDMLVHYQLIFSHKKAS